MFMKEEVHVLQKKIELFVQTFFLTNRRFKSVGSHSQPGIGVCIKLAIYDLWDKTRSQEKDKLSSQSLSVIGYEKSKVEQHRAKSIFRQKKKWKVKDF